MDVDKMTWREGRTHYRSGRDKMINPSTTDIFAPSTVILGLRRLKPPRGAGWEPRCSDGRQSPKLLVVAASRAN